MSSLAGLDDDSERAQSLSPKDITPGSETFSNLAALQEDLVSAEDSTFGLKAATASNVS